MSIKLLQQIWRRIMNTVGGSGVLDSLLNYFWVILQRRQTAEQDVTSL